MSTIALPSATRITRGMNPLYPFSDGKSMADNDLQYRWIASIKGNLEVVFQHRKDVYIAADMLVYPVEKQPGICQAPDVFVVFGRPEDIRGSYIVHEEDHIFPQVVFEIRSPSNTAEGMAQKLAFYEHYGAEEYYDYDPDRKKLLGYRRKRGALVEIQKMNGFISPLLGIRFETGGKELVLYRPDGKHFLTHVEYETALDSERKRTEQEKQRAEQEKQRAEQEKQRAEQEKQRAEQEKQRAEQEKQRAEQEKQRADRFLEMLRAAGIDPDAAPTA